MPLLLLLWRLLLPPLVLLPLPPLLSLLWRVLLLRPRVLLLTGEGSLPVPLSVQVHQLAAGAFPSAEERLPHVMGCVQAAARAEGRDGSVSCVPVRTEVSPPPIVPPMFAEGCSEWRDLRLLLGRGMARWARPLAAQGCCPLRGLQLLAYTSGVAGCCVLRSG